MMANTGGDFSVSVDEPLPAGIVIGFEVTVDDEDVWAKDYEVPTEADEASIAIRIGGVTEGIRDVFAVEKTGNCAVAFGASGLSFAVDEN